MPVVCTCIREWQRGSSAVAGVRWAKNVACRTLRAVVRCLQRLRVLFCTRGRSSSDGQRAGGVVDDGEGGGLRLTEGPPNA